jgi:hypothetical protein
VGELSKLIDAASRANHGRSMQAAAELATKRGAPISKSHISKNARQVETVTPQLIRGIAAGYEVPEEEVARAVLADLGFVINDYSPSPESAIRRDPGLSSEARAMLLAAIGAARTPSRGREDSQAAEGLTDERGTPLGWLPPGTEAGREKSDPDRRRGEVGGGG